MKKSKTSTATLWRVYLGGLVSVVVILFAFVAIYRPLDTSILVAAVIAAIVFPVMTIAATYLCTQENINELKSSTKRQVEVLTKGFTKQIENTQKATERQSEILETGFQAVIEDSQEQSKTITKKLDETKESVNKLAESLGEKLEALESEAEEGKQRLEELQALEEQRSKSE
ncbi:MAG: hypothetical protein ACXABY_08585, partial [Candidatus Thorarchaeota archaeon]